MNKYYLGFPAPEELVPLLKHSQAIASNKLGFDTKLETNFHCTLFYIGEASEQSAREYYNAVHGYLAPQTALMEFQAFTKAKGPFALVLRLLNTEQLKNMHAACTRYNTERRGAKHMPWAYNPHFTLAKTDTTDSWIPSAAQYLNQDYLTKGTVFMFKQLVLYEKPQDGEYHPLMIYDLK